MYRPTRGSLGLSDTMKRIYALVVLCFLTACSNPTNTPAKKEPEAKVYFKVDPATAGTLSGKIRFTGRKPARKAIDMSEDPACADSHKEKIYDDPVAVGSNGTLANVFVYIKTGLEGKAFEAPTAAVTIDQRGCWFRPRVFGIQTGQTLQVTNSDPVTHNIHPLAQVNREWNHSQGQGDAPLARRFVKPEIMIRVKCNIHSWMRAYIGVVEHPYFAVTGANGTFEIRNVPPGDYTLGVWQETLGTQEQKISVPPSGKVEADFTFKGE